MKEPIKPRFEYQCSRCGGEVDRAGQTISAQIRACGELYMVAACSDCAPLLQAALMCFVAGIGASVEVREEAIARMRAESDRYDVYVRRVAAYRDEFAAYAKAVQGEAQDGKS